MAGAKPYTEQQIIDMLRTQAMRYYARSFLRNAALFALGLSTGCRVSELVIVRLGDLVDEYGGFKTDLRLWQVKTKTYRTVPVEGKLIYRFLPRYISMLNVRGYVTEQEWLFPGHSGGHLSVRTVNRIYAAAHKELKLAGYSPHSTRKTWAVQVYTQIVKANRTGVIAVDPFEKLCDLGGWQSYDAARRYICDAVDCRRDIQAAIYPALSAYLGGVSET